MLKPFIFILLCVLLSCSRHVTQAQKESAPTDTIPGWVKETIVAFKSKPVQDPRAEVYMGEYKGMVVYSVPIPWCCDQISYVRTADGKEVCRFGGFAGSNTCPDFDKEFKNKKLLWKDDR